MKIGHTERETPQPPAVAATIQRVTLKPTVERMESGTIILATLAAAALTAVRWESTQSIALLMATTTAFVAGPWLVWLAMRFGIGQRFEGLLPAVCALWTLLPLAAGMLLRQAGMGDANEIIVLACLQNAALAVAAYSHHRRCQHASCLLSGFLSLFALAIGTTPAVYVIVGLFGVLLVWWFMARYWERVQRTVSAEKTESCLPMRSSVLGIVAVASLLLLVALGTSRPATNALRGFMPFSGGDKWSDEYARAGVGDGDAVVAARDEAMSFGPVESELFLDSEMPSLYDMFNDMYGDPISRKKKVERAVGLAPDEVVDLDMRIAKTERSGREFATVRRQAQRKRQELKDRKTPAMLYVVGRVPLHLALERFDTFDGETWTHSGVTQRHTPIRIEHRQKKPWARLTREGASQIHRGIERHALKIINLKTNRFPSPPQLSAIHVDLVKDADFYGWTEDDVAYMPVRDHIPQLTVAHLRSQGVQLQPLRERDFSTRFPSTRVRTEDERTAVDVQAELIARHLETPKVGPATADAVASWTQNVPRGWRQVEAVVERLRSEFELDPQAAAPEGCPDVAEYFLETGRGPDYLFATTAAVLLRKLGYPTRLVTGFYARKQRFDRLAGQTSVLRDDVHAWVEVNVDGRVWIPIEPTPGYEPPRENRTWLQWAVAGLLAFVEWCGRNAPLVGASLVLLCVLVIFRQAFLDALMKGACRLLGRRSAKARLTWTIRLLEWRAWLVGRPRPERKTIANWYGPLIDALPSSSQSSLRRFFRWSDRLLYSTDAIDDADTREIVQVCSAAESSFPRKTLRAALNSA